MNVYWSYSVVLLLYCTAEYCRADILKKAVCLTDGASSSEVYLSCSPGLLYIRSARQGYQEREDGEECEYMEENECSIPYTATIVKNCQGKSECTAAATSVLLGPCGVQGNYVQVEYECINDNSEEPGNMLDICGDYLAGTEIRRSQGYVESVNYPYVYTSNTVCSCTFATDSPDAQLALTVLDLDMQTQASNGDWVEYARDLETWGRAFKLQMDDVGEEVLTGMSRMMLNFNSDARSEKRGFWLGYRGLGDNGQEEKVNVSCSKITPSRFRESIVCFEETEQNNEIYLSCQSLGVINVLRAHHGYSEEESMDKCSTITEDRCVVNSLNRYGLLEKCMGQIDCVVDVDEVPVPICSQDSNYFQVHYQCVEDTQQFNIIDICGDITRNEIVLREEGYIESLNYPQDYPPHAQCECSMEATRESAEIILSVLDMQVAALQPRDTCEADWLEYRALSQDWGHGKKLCDVTVGDSISTGVNKIFLNFQTGEDGTGRGFWIKYYGRNADGTKSSVKLECATLSRLDVLVPAGSTPASDVTTPPAEGGTVNNSADDVDDEPINLTLIIGLCAIALLMLIIVLSMVIFKYRSSRHRNKSGGMSPAGGAGVPSQMDTGYSTFGHSPYQNMRDTHSSASSSVKSGPSTSRSTPAYSFSEPAPDYADPVHYMHPGAKTGASKAYINPSFTGNLHA